METKQTYCAASSSIVKWPQVCIGKCYSLLLIWVDNVHSRHCVCCFFFYFRKGLTQTHTNIEWFIWLICDAFAYVRTVHALPQRTIDWTMSKCARVRVIHHELNSWKELSRIAAKRFLIYNLQCVRVCVWVCVCVCEPLQLWIVYDAGMQNDVKSAQRRRLSLHFTLFIS